MSDQIHTYTEHQAILLEAQLRKQIRAALRRQHPEWIDANGKSPLCDSYEARFTELLAIPTKKVDSRDRPHHLRSSPQLKCKS
jgi:hypothetical protein